MISIKFFPIFLLCLFAPLNLWALVDYSEMTGTQAPASTSARPTPPPPAVAPAPAQATIIQRQAPNRSRATRQHLSWLNLSLGYESLSAEGEQESGKLARTQLRAQIQTRYGIFVQAHYWQGQSTSSYLTESSHNQAGNATAIIGFHWLKFGAPHELALIDLYGGASFGGSSELARSATDKIAGIETSKRLGDFLIGLGFEYRFNGQSKNASELSVGDAQKISATLGWLATPDIQFLIEGVSARVRQNGEGGLGEDQTFGYISPKLGLGLRSFVQLELGARFRTKQAADGNALIDARLWDFAGAMGTSLFVNLNLAI